MKVTVIIKALITILKDQEKKIGGLEIQGRIENILTIALLNQNTLESSGELKRLAHHMDSSENLKLHQVWITHKK